MRRLATPFLIAALVLIGGTGLIASVASASTAALPSVAGGFNQTPKITFPKNAPPSTLQVSYLHRGNGPKVVAGELLVANYLGQIWGGKVFDSSFSRKQLSALPDRRRTGHSRMGQGARRRAARQPRPSRRPAGRRLRIERATRVPGSPARTRSSSSSMSSTPTERPPSPRPTRSCCTRRRAASR